MASCAPLALVGLALCPIPLAWPTGLYASAGRAMGLVNAGGSVGQLLIIPASMALLLWTDWRTTYLILGGLLLLVGVSIALLLLRSRPQDIGLLPDGAIVLAEGEPGLTQPPQASAQAPLEPVHWRGEP
jgi:hypothetical protein